MLKVGLKEENDLEEGKEVIEAEESGEEG